MNKIKVAELAQLFRALAFSERLTMCGILETEAMTSAQLAERMKMSKEEVINHLLALQQGKLVRSLIVKEIAHYSLCVEQFRPIIDFVSTMDESAPGEK